MKSAADGDGVMDKQLRISSQEVMCMFAGLTLLLLQDALFFLRGERRFPNRWAGKKKRV